MSTDPSLKLDRLFTPVTINGLTLASRFAMAPMTREFSPGGVPTAEVANYYARRARHGVALIISEGTFVNHPSAGNSTRVPRFYGEDALAGWRHVVQAVHEAGGRIVPQLWHMGSGRRAATGPHPEAPSISAAGSRDTSPMTLSDIDAVVAAFVEAAVAARLCGFDGLELHGAHGYLIDDFLWERTNQRTDRYGGGPANRARFAAEIVAACRAAVGPDFPILFRISNWKSSDYDATLATDPQALGALLAPLADAGVDMFHCSARRYWEPIFPHSPMGLAGWVRQLTGVATMTVGSVGLQGDLQETLTRGGTTATADLDRLLVQFDEGQFDMVAVGRSLLGDAAWVEKVNRGAFDELRPYDAAYREVLN